MIPSASALPLPAPAPELADQAFSSGPDSRQTDADTPSFASRLDQFVTPTRPQPASDPAKRPPVTLAQRDAAHAAQNADQAGKASANAQTPADTQGQSTASPADSDAQTGNGAGKSAGKSAPVSKEDKNEDKTEENTVQDKPVVVVNSTAVNPLSAVPLPITPVTLAITVGVSPLPVPVQPSVPAKQANGAALLPKASAASTLVSPPIASLAVPGASLAVTPLNLPGVPMDSRAASQTAAPRVVNALPQNAVVPAQVSPTTPLMQTAPKTNNSDGKAASTPEASSIAPSVLQTPIALKSALAANAPTAADLRGIVLPQNAVTAAPKASANPVQQTNGKQADIQTATTLTPATGNALPGAANGVKVPSTGGNLPEVSTAEQHFGGIERLFTLGANKTTDTQTAQTIAVEPGKGDAPTPANAVTLPAQNAVSSKQTSVPITAQIHGAATGSGVSVTALSPAATSSPASGQASSVPTSLVSPTLAATGGQTGAMSLSPDGIRVPNGAAALASTGTTSGVNGGTGNALLAPVPAPGQTGGDASADDESRNDASNQESASPAAESATDSATSANAANPFNGLRASGETTASNAVASPSGSSQIDRAQVVEQVTRHLESMRVSGGEGEMRLRLAPQHLGNVQISVATHQDGVVARISVETAQIQQVMDGAKEHLRATLEARGLRVSGVEVTVTPNLIGTDSAAFAQQRGWQPTGERADVPPRYPRANSTGQMSGDSLASVPVSAPIASLSLSRLDYRA